jgi:tetratricopeptide (TPR) repeat protein
MVSLLNHNRTVARILLAFTLIVSGCSRNPEARAARFFADGQRLYQKGDFARAILQYKTAIQAQPANAAQHYHLGLAYLAVGDGRSSLAEFNRAIELDPTNHDAQLMASKLLLGSRNKEMMLDSVKRIQQLIAIAPQTAEAWNVLALAEWQLGKQEASEQRFQEALSRFPGNLKASVSLAQIKMQRQEYAEAERILRDAVGRDPAAALPLVALAEFCASQARAGEAEQLLRRAIQLEPKSDLARLELLSLLVRAGRTEEAAATYKNLDGKQYRLFYASLLFDAGKYAEAIDGFERIAKEDPKNRESRTWLVRAYLRANRLADAERVLNGALQQNPQDVDALMQRSLLHLWARDDKAAQNDVAQVLHFRPDSAQAHYVLAKVYAARGALLSQRQEFTEALRINPSFLAARIDLAQTFIAAGDGKQALAVMNATPEADRELLPVITARNWALIAAGEVGELRKGVEKLMALSTTSDSLLQEALLQLSDRNFAGARVWITRVLDQSPADVRALDLLARSYALENRAPQAAHVLQEYAASHPRSAPIHYVLGQWALTQGNREEAKKAFESALSANPRFPPASLALAYLEIAAKNVDSARSRLSALLTEEKHNVPARLMLADLEQSAGNSATALAAYKTVLDTEPDNIAALNNVAYLLAEYAKKPDEALVYAQRAQQLSPDNPAVEDTLGWVLYSKGLYAGALPHLKNAVHQEPTDRRLYHVAMAYLKAGHRDLGKKALDEALKQNPQLQEASVARSLLAKPQTLTP